MANDITCNLCGGTDFYKESGYFYCNECQTQSQDIREHTFATALAEDVDVEATSSTTSSKSRGASSTEQITSWECYNYILLGLINELLELGADPKLREVVKKLWFMYLTKLEVISEDPTTPPKLSAIHSKM